MKLKTKLTILVSIILLIGLTNIIRSVYDGSVGLFNTTTVYRLDYQRKSQEIVSFYDAKYLAFSKKENIANINKDAFVLVTSIIMDNRRDGEQLAWKWVHENQHIPYEEFTIFYKELSAFVDEQYGGLFELEKQRQAIVNEHNKLISIYPNNIFNSFFVHEPLMVYKHSVLSDSTRKLFNL